MIIKKVIIIKNKKSKVINYKNSFIIINNNLLVKLYMK